MVWESTTQPAPVLLPDGAIMAPIVAPCDDWGRLRLLVPAGAVQPHDLLAGRYLLIRCTPSAGLERDEEWGLYLRRPLFFCGRRKVGAEEEWCMAVPLSSTDPGYRWLAKQQTNTYLNILGPLGNGFQLHAGSRNLLLLVDLDDDPVWLPQLMPLVERMLDRGGRVALLAKTMQPRLASLLDTMPTALEIRIVHDAGEWQHNLAETVPWADQVCAGMPMDAYNELFQSIRSHRFHVTEGFGQVLVKADLLCGVGACLACVVPTANGRHTRACIHGPVFDLTQVAL